MWGLWDSVRSLVRNGVVRWALTLLLLLYCQAFQRNTLRGVIGGFAPQGAPYDLHPCEKLHVDKLSLWMLYYASPVPIQLRATVHG